jgi:hypothetical protein
VEYLKSVRRIVVLRDPLLGDDQWTENPTTCAMVGCKVSEQEIKLYGLCVSVINHLIINPIIRTRTRLISGIHATIYTFCHRLTATPVYHVFQFKGIMCRHLYTLLMEYISCFEKMKANIWDNLAVCLCTLSLQSAGTVEPEKMAVAGRHLGNCIST